MGNSGPIGPAFYLPLTVLRVHERVRGLRSPSASWGPGSCFGLPQGVYQGATTGGDPWKTSAESRTAPCPQNTRQCSARCRRGSVLVVAHGVSSGMLAGLILAGLATVVTETKRVPRGLTITVERIRVTEDGRKSLED